MLESASLVIQSGLGHAPLEQKLCPWGYISASEILIHQLCMGWEGPIWQTKVSNGAPGKATQLILCALSYGYAFAFC